MVKGSGGPSSTVGGSGGRQSASAKKGDDTEEEPEIDEDVLVVHNSGRSRISRRGGRQPHGGHQLPRRLHFEKFVCQNERIWTLRGCALVVPPGSTNA